MRSRRSLPGNRRPERESVDGTLELVTPPTVEPVTVQECKDWMRVTLDDEDTLITDLIAAARGHVEELTGRALLTQTWDYWLDEFPYCEMDIPRPKIQSVTYIKYLDTSGVLQTLSSSLYTVDTKRSPGRIVPSYGNVWPVAQYVPNAVQVRYIAGYGDEPEDVPTQLRQATKVLVATMYENREAMSDVSLETVPMAFYQLLNQHRMWWL